MKRRWKVWAAALPPMTADCAMVVGIDEDYHAADDGAAMDCQPADKQCWGSAPQTCDEKGRWQSAPVCSEETELCVAGACAILPKSCTGMPRTCGPNGDESCCSITTLPGGTYYRSNDPTAPATVSEFHLDRFEITVGRFRKFMEAYPGSNLVPGAGAHPRIESSGWDPAWDMFLLEDKATWSAAVKGELPEQPCKSDSPDPAWYNPTWPGDAPNNMNENLPMNCITWYEAFAFCAWDGGRLPTEAEWNYGAAGGGEQRPYPWGRAEPDVEHALYNCTGDGSPGGECTLLDILTVGSKPAGDGRFGQADLAGSVWEWNLDWYAGTYRTPWVDEACINCICTECTPTGSYLTLRGGSWSSTGGYLLSSNRSNESSDATPSNRIYGNPARRWDYVGARCARSL